MTSARLFTACLGVFHRENRGIIVDGGRLNHLQSADKIVLISNNAEELKIMMKELNVKSQKIGLAIDMEKQN